MNLIDSSEIKIMLNDIRNDDNELYITFNNYYNTILNDDLLCRNN